MELHSQDKWVDWVDTLANDDYLIIDDFLSEALFTEIKLFLLEKTSHAFRRHQYSLSHQF